MLVYILQVTNPRMLRCAKHYVKEASAIVGSQYEQVMYAKMTRPIVTTQYKNLRKTQIVLNIAPGSTGTKSMFVAMGMLNITSRHYSAISVNCSKTYINQERKFFLDRLEPLADENLDHIWWGDIPVSEDWWYAYAQYPEETRFVMTDMDYDKWFAGRSKSKCCCE